MNDLEFNINFSTSEDLDASFESEDALGIGFGDSIKGDPGFSPIAKVRREGNKVYITITDEEGTTEEYVEDGSEGTTDHAELSNRDAEDQHPKSAITGLTADLAARPSEAITDAYILNL